MDEATKDLRFAHIVKDPKFRRIPRSERKVKVDKRFEGMFKDKKFMVKYTIDKRGRPVNQTSTENLKKYYDLSSSSEDEDSTDTINIKDKTKKKKEKLKQNEINGNEKNVNKKEKPESSDNEQLDDKDKDSSDNDFISSNGSLLRIKSTQESDDKDNTESEAEDAETGITEEDISKNEKELHKKKKDENVTLTNTVKERLKDLTVDYARGEGVLLTDSSSDEESSEYSDEEEIEHNWGELDKEADTTDEVTCRLAVCNMDWDRIRAVDLMILFNSFLPSGGVVRAVTIYPSEFGLQRMKEEEIKGPIELTDKTNKEEGTDNENDDEEGSEYRMEKLRQYQLNRLKYYYAVVEFDSAETANKVYTECDGIEYESTATKLDLRFIPDDMEFDQEPKETCTEIPDLVKYQPRQFTTTALQQVKVQLTWDETNPERLELAQKLNSGKLDEVNDNDLQAYLASGTSDDESDKELEKQENQEDADSDTNSDPIEKYKSLLKDIEEKEEAKKTKDVELEFTWGLDTEAKAEKLVKEKLKKEEEENMTPFERYLEKRKAKKKAKREEQRLKTGDKDDLLNSDSDSADDSRLKKKSEDDTSNDEESQRKAELELLLMDKNEENKRHFNMKEIEENATMSKSKRKRLGKKKGDQTDVKEDDFEVNVEDPRFNALFTSHHFNIDPADPHYRKTKGTKALISEKLKRRAIDDDEINETKPKRPKEKIEMNAELQALVKSVKKNASNALIK